MLANNSNQGNAHTLNLSDNILKDLDGISGQTVYSKLMKAKTKKYSANTKNFQNFFN